MACSPPILIIVLTLLSGHDLHVAFRLMRGRRKREHLKAFGMGRPMREWWTTNDEVDRGPHHGRPEMKMSFGVGWMNVSASLPHGGKTCPLLNQAYPLAELKKQFAALSQTPDFSPLITTIHFY